MTSLDVTLRFRNKAELMSFLRHRKWCKRELKKREGHGLSNDLEVMMPLKAIAFSEVLSPLGTMKNIFSTSTFLVHRTHVLLVLHKRFNLWLPVGGELELNERPLHGAIREVKEETGVELTLKNFPENTVPGGAPGFLCYEEHPAGVKDGVERRHLNFAFHADVVNRDVELCDEHEDFRWIDLSNFADYFNDDLGLTTRNVLWCLAELRRRLSLEKKP